jgi:hypothetical protein
VYGNGLRAARVVLPGRKALVGKHSDRMVEDLALRGMAQTTVEVYVDYARSDVTL